MFSQDITGKWFGLLNVSGAQLRLELNIQNQDSIFVAQLISIDQNNAIMNIDKIEFLDLNLEFSIEKSKISYKGTLKDTIINGIFFQQTKFPLNFQRSPIKKKTINHFQEPKKPYPYYEEEVFIKNKKDKIILAGTLTLPQKEGKFPAVILISGSGPQNRNEEIIGHKPFLVISDFLTRNGIAVLRFDDRGIGKSKGNFSKATTYDFSNDVEAIFKYLQKRKEIIKNKIGLIGHSEGAMIASMVASRNKNIDFVIFLAGPGIPIDSLLIMQTEAIAKASGLIDDEIEITSKLNFKIYQLVKSENNLDSIKLKTKDLMIKFQNDNPDLLESLDEKSIDAQIQTITNTWFRYFIKFIPELYIKNIKCPLLALNGNKDLQVIAKENLSAIEKILKKNGNNNVIIKELDNQNHLFQECETGSPSEYSEIEQTFSPIALNEILKFINSNIK
ncbi:MAG: alpha/beta fold hydrolase [Bacteroidales bacterium]|jgi:pimeloyl-ACP methyl ester carboxylesterase|nr:alpha/beta fold hydrolase [Bacteroidales bacterium]